MNGNETYYLMHRDDIVTAVMIDPISGSIVKAANTINKQLLPPGGNLSADSLKHWWARRAVPVSQGKMDKILKERGIIARGYLVKNLSFSLSDHYWIRPVDMECSWEEINLFSNPFRDEIGELQFGNNEEQEIDLTNRTRES